MSFAVLCSIASGLGRGRRRRLDLSRVAPAELVQVHPGRPPDYMPARRTHWLTVHTGTLGGEALEEALLDTEKPSAMSNFARTLQVFREAGGIELGVPAGVRTFVDGPDIAGVTITQELVGEGEVQNRIALDLWHRSLSARPVTDVAASMDPAVLAGVLPHLIERMMAGEATPGPDGPERRFASVGSIFEAAAREGIGTVVIRRPEDVDALPYQPDALARLRASVARGAVALAPERPLGPDGRVGWWLVDPATGRTVDEMDDGRGTVDQYAATVRVTVVETAGPMEDLGICLALIYWTAALTAVTIVSAAAAAAAASQGQTSMVAMLGAATVVGSGTVGGIIGSGAEC